MLKKSKRQGNRPLERVRRAFHSEVHQKTPRVSVLERIVPQLLRRTKAPDDLYGIIAHTDIPGFDSKKFQLEAWLRLKKMKPSKEREVVLAQLLCEDIVDQQSVWQVLHNGTILFGDGLRMIIVRSAEYRVRAAILLIQNYCTAENFVFAYERLKRKEDKSDLWNQFTVLKKRTEILKAIVAIPKLEGDGLLWLQLSGAKAEFLDDIHLLVAKLRNELKKRRRLHYRPEDIVSMLGS